MLSHKHIWGAIDALATRYGHSPSGLARAAGLDPTTFNKSKRHGPKGRLRWPSTESLAKILHVTGATIEDFVALLQRSAGAKPPSVQLPFLKLKDAAKKKVFVRAAAKFKATGARAAKRRRRQAAPRGFARAPLPSRQRRQ